MKKIVLGIMIALLSTHSFAQKKKATAKKKAIPVAVTAVQGIPFAKFENLTAEVKGTTFQVAITDKNNPGATIVIKTVGADFKPLECKFSTFKTNGKQLYLLSWTEKSTTATETKSEAQVVNNTCILELSTKKLVLSNTETITHTTEKVFLDKGKNASETQQKIKREGYQFVLNSDGTIILKNKSSENHLVYDAAKMEYVAKKK